MKKLLLTGATLAVIAGTAVAQGYFLLDNTLCACGLAVDQAGNYYAGTFSVEVWELNGTPDPALFNAINALDNAPLSQGGGGVVAYALMLADGFKLEATLVGQTTQAGAPGVIDIYSPVRMPDVPYGGGTVTVALAIWNNTASSWASMIAGATANTRAGVTAFDQDTGPRLPFPITTWNTYDLVMTTVPEPGTLVLAGLGAAALVVFRRRKLQA